MDWTFDKRKCVVPDWAVPDRLSEFIRLNVLWGMYLGETPYLQGLTVLADLEHHYKSRGILFRLREVYYDASHGVGALAGM